MVGHVLSAAISPVLGSHVWVASAISIVILLLATFALFGFSVQVLRGLVLGADNRASTSKFQATAWTYAILFALLALLVGHLLYADFDPGWDKFLDEGLNSDYLWLLAIPSVGLVGAKAITQSKVQANPDAKPTKTDPDNSLLARTRELASNDNDDNPQPALGDLQYLVFNGVAVAYFLSAFLGHVERGLPSAPRHAHRVDGCERRFLPLSQGGQGRSTAGHRVGASNACRPRRRRDAARGVGQRLPGRDRHGRDARRDPGRRHAGRRDRRDR